MRGPTPTFARRAIFLAATAAFGLTACGDDDSSSTAGAQPPAPTAAPGTLATTAGVSANLAVVAGEVPLPLVRPLDFTRVAAPATQYRLQHAGLAAVISCDASGTRDAMQSLRDLGSPYTDSALLVTRTVYARCVDFAGAPDDPHSATRELHGAEEFAEALTPQGAVLYVAVGDAQTLQPLERRHRATVGGVEHEEETLALGRADALLDSVFDVDAQFNLSRTFVVTTARQTVATGSYRIGSAAEPFRLESHNRRTQFLVDGDFQFQSGRCDPGPAHVSTSRALEYDPIRNRFVGGLLSFTAAQGTATAEFNADGTVTLMDTQGRTTTIDWRARIGPWEGNECFEP